jgi:NadR type nicotinamide-nucleotide adenylyltransferase
VTGFRHGLLIGKFYPPHVGHHAAIREAARQCEQVSVVVMAALVESIPLADRVEWLRAEHADDAGVHVVGIRCDAPLDLRDEQVWAAQVAAMQAALRTRPDAPPVDAVYSADDYGAELARRFDAKFVPVERPAGQPSSTAVRQDLAAAWTTLAPATRAGLVTRVVFLGAESTGTTTLSERLVQHWRARGGVWARTAWVAEYGREYTAHKWHAARVAGRPELALDDLAWDVGDFDRVAEEQVRREERAARSGSPVLVCDTDAFATAVWERRYLGARARNGQPWARGRGSLYLLTDHADVPWHDDGMREGDLQIRAAMTTWFADALTAAGHSWVLLTGTLEQRHALAVRSVEQVLRHRMRFGAPLTGPGFPC